MIYDCLIRKLNWLIEKKDVEDHHQDLEQNHQGIHVQMAIWSEMFCHQPPAICWLVAAIERNVETKRQKTHTPIQNDTHTHTNWQKDLMKPPSNITHRSQSIKKKLMLVQMLAKVAAPSNRFRAKADVVTGPGPIRFDAETWRSRLTSDSLQGNFSARIHPV